MSVLSRGLTDSAGPLYTGPFPPKRSSVAGYVKRLALIVALCGTSLITFSLREALRMPHHAGVTVPFDAAEILTRCASLNTLPGPPPDFYERTRSDRFVSGTPPTLLKNASIWSGTNDELVNGDIFLEGGIIKAVGNIASDFLGRRDLVTLHLNGSWVTPGIIDLHSHAGVSSSPSLRGGSDSNSILGPVQPYLRALDGLNTHDEAYRLSIAGGLTSSLVLPGSADNMGGQGIFIKLRKTAENSPSSMVLEPPYSLFNRTLVDPTLPPRWRHSKHACGENPSRVYSSTRMDSIYRFRAAYAAAAAVRDAQDAYCTSAQNGDWHSLGQFPESLELEALVETLRGRFKVNVHCYEAVDIDGIVRLSNEFRFSIAAFHHAAETYLVPDLLKKAWGPPPASAIFATFARYKREAYRSSEFAAKLLSEQGLQVIMKSDGPQPLRSRHLMFEAQQAYYFGLNASLALASVTSTPAEVAGYGHRIGSIKEGYDADVVVWDSHPLLLGATPKQVWIDGIAQFSEPFVMDKPSEFQRLPPRPFFPHAAHETVEYDGEPPLEPKKIVDDAVFLNVKTIWQKDSERNIQRSFSAENGPLANVVIRGGSMVCFSSSCELPSAAESEHIDLEGGSLAPGLVTVGSPMGLTEIILEASTSDGIAYDYLSGGGVPVVLGDDGAVLRAVDGLQFYGRDPLLAYRSGVTMAITAPTAQGFLSGLSTAWSTGAKMKTEKGAVLQPIAALHVRIGHQMGSQPSISAQIATLRKLLLKSHEDSPFSSVAKGHMTLVVDVDNADIIATLLELKAEVEETSGSVLKLTLIGAAESHLLAHEIAEAGVGVIVAPPRTFPEEWDQKRTLPGPPLSHDTVISALLAHNVTVGIGTDRMWQWQARNTRFEAGWAGLAVWPRISKEQMLEMVTTNLEKLLGLETAFQTDLVAYSGGDMFENSKVVGVISSRGDAGHVELF